MLNDSQMMAQVPYGMNVPTVFKAEHYFHAVALTGRECGRKQLNIFQNAVNSTLAGMVVEVVQKSWDALTKPCPPRPLRVAIQPYLVLHSCTNRVSGIIAAVRRLRIAVKG